MIRGIYSAAAGMITQYKRIDILGNNTANVNTTGYKASKLTLSDFGQELARRSSDDKTVGTMPICVVLNRETTDLTQGGLRNTGSNTDLAIDGDGFFAVQSPEGGDIKYTRSGNFSIDANGFLALPTGDRLLDQNRAAVFVGSSNFAVESDGTIRLANGATDKVDLYSSNAAANINKRTDGFFNINGIQAGNGRIKQGWLEGSNTDVVNNTVEMMAATRAFQGCQQAYQVSAQALEKLVTQIGTLK